MYTTWLPQHNVKPLTLLRGVVLSPFAKQTYSTNCNRTLGDSNDRNYFISLSFSRTNEIIFGTNINNFSSLTKPINQHIVLVDVCPSHEIFTNIISNFSPCSTVVFLSILLQKYINEKPRKNNQNTHFGWPKGEHHFSCVAIVTYGAYDPLCASLRALIFGALAMAICTAFCYV